MTVGRVKDFNFPRSGPTQVRAHTRGKVEKTMHEFKAGALHSGSKHGPLVKNPKQAVAIALNQQRKAGMGMTGVRKA